jgi:uncharacterized protein with HEPN domain
LSVPSVTRDPKFYLHDLLKYTERIEKTISGLDYNAFFKNQDKIDIVDANMGKIGEAIRVLNKYPRVRDQFFYYHVPVKKLINMRKVLVHEYFGLDIEGLWQTANEILSLKPKFEKIYMLMKTYGSQLCCK